MTTTEADCADLHVAIIMDGNGRWAKARGLPRKAGHVAGVSALRRIIEAAPSLGIATLTVYAFSADNWRRPADEVAALMGLLRGYLEREIGALIDAGVRLSVMGRRDRLPGRIADLMTAAEAATAHGKRLHFRVAVDYSGRDAILAAAAALDGAPTREAMTRQLSGGQAVRDVDLLIRTSGEQRLSDFMLWEAAYAELLFTDRLWPDFDGSDLKSAVGEFYRRERRFGGVAAAEAIEDAPLIVAAQ
jgi:undecaprenyl diphosphate synthase